MMNYFPKRLVLVRHGQSLLNVVRAKSPIFFETEKDREAFKGIPDQKVRLSEKGIEQAKLTGIALRKKGFHFTRAYDSGYVRTEMTLDGILEAYSEEERKEIIRRHSILIRERETGYTYCMSKPYIDQTYPWLQEYWQTLGPIFARPIGGESIADVIQRVQMFFHEIFFEARNEEVIAAIHGRVLTCIRYILEGWTYAELEAFLKKDHDDASPINCGVTIYEYDPRQSKMVLKEYNTQYW